MESGPCFGNMKETRHDKLHARCSLLFWKACPLNSLRGLIVDRDRPANSKRCPKFVHTYKHRDLGCVSKSTYTVRVPDLRLLGMSPERSPVETRTKNSKWKFIANAAHGTSSRPQHLGRTTWKIPGETHTKYPKRKNSSRMRHTVRVPNLRILGTSPERSPVETRTQKFKAKIHRERGTRYEFPTWGSWARRLKDPQEKHIQKLQSENSLRTRNTVRVPELTTKILWYTAESGKITSAAAVSLSQHKSQSAEGDYHVNVLNLPLSNTKHRHTRVRSSLAPIFSTSTRLNSLEKPVTTWLLLNLSEQAYHFLFVSNAEEYTRSNTNAISSKCRADHAVARAVTEELIVAQSHQNHKTDKCWQHLVIDQNSCGEFLSVLQLVMWKAGCFPFEESPLGEDAERGHFGITNIILEHTVYIRLVFRDPCLSRVCSSHVCLQQGMYSLGFRASPLE